MLALFSSVLIGIALVITVAAGWRLLSRRRILPCPSSFIWLLENRIVERVAGSAALIEQAGIQPGMKVLDAGCGSGRLTIPLARRVGAHGEVVAVDVQPSMLSKLKERLEQQNVANVRLIQGALGTGVVTDGDFDRAFLITVLGEIPDQASALGEIYEQLKPGGILSVTEVLPDPHYQTRSTVRGLAQKTGFVASEVQRTYRSFTMHLLRPPSATSSATTPG
jgi:ubiquinone/menaquinone biosynthesis C-methylase UbiE